MIHEAAADQDSVRAAALATPERTEALAQRPKITSQKGPEKPTGGFLPNLVFSIHCGMFPEKEKNYSF